MRRHLLAAAGGYALGTIPSADLAARLARGPGADLRDEGTGNPGAANAMGVLGKSWGAAVMVADIAKGAAAGVLGRRIAGGSGADVASTAAVVGHCLPVWNGFRGGKGVATSVGQVIATFPPYFPIDALLAGGTVKVPGLRRPAFTATTVATSGWVLASTLWWRRGLPNLWAAPAGPSLPVGAAVSSAVIVWRFVEAERAAGPGS
ncbi:MAG: glycerol-3-phosphate acyltransferase [Actinomycetota bacterium]